MFLGACSTLLLPQVPRGCGLCPLHTGEDCSGLQLPFQHLHGTPAPATETGAGLQLQHTFMRALQKLLEIPVSILGNTSNCSMNFTADLPPFHE